jgi:RNA polymerase Rpb2, domain 2
VALDYIGKRGATVGVTREKRIKYAKEILQKEMLPHVGVGEFCETKKAYYFGWPTFSAIKCFPFYFGLQLGILITILYFFCEGTLFIGCCYVLLVGGLKMTETIMVIKGWTLQVHY